VADDLSRAEARILELEVRYTHQQETIKNLSDVIYRQQQQLDALSERLKLLESKLGAVGEIEPVRDLEDEVPPHY
jgi:uncharacterized coiled-coil protein SlyX